LYFPTAAEPSIYLDKKVEHDELPFYRVTWSGEKEPKIEVQISALTGNVTQYELQDPALPACDSDDCPALLRKTERKKPPTASKFR
jgi:hypothetical protein